MMGTSKPLASLSSGLLARKGQARPAMRPQAFGLGAVNPAFEDLGWNDMGEPMSVAAEPPMPEPAPVVPLPMPVAVPAPVAAPPAEQPLVLRQRAKLREEIETAEPEATEPAPAEQHEAPLDLAPLHAAKSKAAFTLRLDAGRHLRLRLASALGRRSAQRLVTEALDQFLSTMPEVEAMARQIEERQSNGGGE